MARGQTGRVGKQSATYRIARLLEFIHTNHQLSSLLLLLVFLARATHSDAGAVEMEKWMEW